jgi:hypothetical protein
MLFMTNVYHRPPPRRVASRTTRRSYTYRSIAAGTGGGVLGLIFGVPFVHVFGLAALVFCVGGGIAVGLFMSTWTPVDGEAWVEFATRKVRRAKANAQARESRHLHIGLVPRPAGLPNGTVRYQQNAIRVNPDEFAVLCASASRRRRK